MVFFVIQTGRFHLIHRVGEGGGGGACGFADFTHRIVIIVMFDFALKLFILVVVIKTV